MSAETIFRKARRRNIGAAIHAWGPVEEQARWIELGANALIHKTDIIFFKEGIRRDLTF